MSQTEIDAAIQIFYTDVFDEHTRLTTRSAQGRLEFERTQELVRAATPAPARLLDVGGGTGVHAAALARDGYEVVLVDPVEAQVAAASLHGTFTAIVGDARTLEFPDDAFDVVLLAGPLYHLGDRAQRLRALREAGRVCRPGGYVHAAAIPRLGAFAIAAVNPPLLDEAPEAWLDLLRHGTPVPGSRFPAGHFHTPAELQEELTAVDLVDVVVVGLEGPAGVALETVEHVAEVDFLAAMRLAQTFQAAPEIPNFSNHLLATGRVQ